ncbi:hypothetical protein GCM10009069_18080 [Algimonas arctica]|uniref:Lipoprotein n=1 Tax=Algimonas arctica TaxID=1479486 RepID=A0A8J3G2H1_9PROT|nr:hypothetical protein [Algimonas arctica]GHA95457.1 hypothetical protein GCM10009069_18080 [Algimonas arctica]
MRRPLFLSCLTALMLSACASLPDAERPIAGELAAIDGATPGMVAAGQANHIYRSQLAQLNDIREAEARVDLARARLDFATVRDRGAGDGDVREFLDARRSLRNLRNVYGPTDTGRPSWGYQPYGYGGHWPRGRRHWTNGPVGTLGLSVDKDIAIGQAMPLSMQSGN